MENLQNQSGGLWNQLEALLHEGRHGLFEQQKANLLCVWKTDEASQVPPVVLGDVLMPSGGQEPGADGAGAELGEVKSL
jgi:hypothetical protein